MTIPMDRHSVAKIMLQDAAALLGWCADYWRDENDRSSNKCHIHYAVDVDVVIMYANPVEKKGYGEVFSQANDVADQVASLLGNYIMQRWLRQPQNENPTRARTDHRLLLIPPHATELKAVAEAISHRQAKIASGDLRAVKAARSELDEKLSGSRPEDATRIFLEYLSAHAAGLHNLLLGQSGAAAEMSRLNALPKGRLVALHQHDAFSKEEWLCRAPARGDSSSDGKKMLKLADDWFKLMIENSHNLSSSKRSNIDDDAWVLASLEWINADAVERKSSNRLVLVTGTQRMFGAGVKRPSLHQGFENFARAYLRDPRSFLGAKDFFTQQGEETDGPTFEILDWMSVLFPRSIRQLSVSPPLEAPDVSTVSVRAQVPDPKQIAEADTTVLNVLLNDEYRQTQSESFPDSALNEWRDVVRDTYKQVILQGQKEAHSEVLKELLQGLPNSGDSRFQHLMSMLAKRVRNSFSGLYLATGVIGVEQLLDKASSMRGIPALRFDLPDHRDAQSQCDTLADIFFRKEGRPETFDLATMYVELARNDDSNYHAHVLHAFVHASSGRWYSARTLCRVALLGAASLTKAPTELRTGREAAYLMAVAERRLATNESRLSLAQAALRDAVARSRGDEVHDVRFASETLAQNMTRRQMRYFLSPAGPGTDSTLDLEPMAALEEAQKLCRFVLSGNDIRTVRRWVIRQSVTNGLLAAILAFCSGLRSPQTVGAARSLIALLEAEQLAPALPNIKTELQLFRDEISDFIWLIAVALFDNQVRAASARDLLRLQQQLKTYNGMIVYEKLRYKEFMQFSGVEPVDEHALSNGDEPDTDRASL